MNCVVRSTFGSLRTKEIHSRVSLDLLPQEELALVRLGGSCDHAYVRLSGGNPASRRLGSGSSLGGGAPDFLFRLITAGKSSLTFYLGGVVGIGVDVGADGMANHIGSAVSHRWGLVAP